MLFTFNSRRRALVQALAIALSLAGATTLIASANIPVTKLSSDPYTNGTSNHKTQVEPDSFAYGATMVAATQVGRFYNGGASNIGWMASTDGGANWANGFLPGITKFAGGPYDRVSDPSVAHDAKHNVWLISALALYDTPYVDGAAVLVSRSTDGGLTWGNPVVVSAATGGSDYDKNWTSCDNTPTSPYYGNCYTQWDDYGRGNLILMSTSSDGGLTWGAPRTTSNRATGIGGQPVVQPNGTVVVPIDDAYETSVMAFVSTNGGASWSSPMTIAYIRSHRVAGNLRTGPLPSAKVDANGKVYVVWQDCRFIRNCKANDIVMSTSTNGVNWSKVKRIPIDGTTSRVDHFIPGLAVDRTTSGANARLAVTFYYYPTANCSTSTCKLNVGAILSNDGGATWSPKLQIAGPMNLSWLPLTTQGYMVGDYISTSYANGMARPIFALAASPAQSGGILNEAIYSTVNGLKREGATFSAEHDREFPDARSDYPASAAPLTAR